MEKVTKLFIEELEQKVAPTSGLVYTTLAIGEEDGGWGNPSPNPSAQAYAHANANAPFQWIILA